jgi:predicted ATPase
MEIDRLPVIVALAGPNGAGKTTFYYAHLQSAGLRLVNADVLARELGIDPYAAARVADGIRRELVNQRESFIFETFFSDPVGEKLTFLKDATQAGYNTILCFIGTASSRISEQRVRCVSPREDTTFRRGNSFLSGWRLKYVALDLRFQPTGMAWHFRGRTRAKIRRRLG